MIQKILLVGIGLIMVWVAYLAYLSNEPFQTPTIKGNVIPILNKDNIKVGGLLETKLSYCIYKQVPTTTTRRFEEIGGNQRVYLLSTSVSSSKPGCHTITVSAHIPGDIPPGRYKIVTNSQYKVNQFETTTATFQTEEFTIR